MLNRLAYISPNAPDEVYRELLPDRWIKKISRETGRARNQKSDLWVSRRRLRLKDKWFSMKELKRKPGKSGLYYLQGGDIFKLD